MTTDSPNMVGRTADAEVDRLVVDVQLDAAVLGHAALGDVQVGHDLDAAGLMAGAMWDGGGIIS